MSPQRLDETWARSPGVAARRGGDRCVLVRLVDGGVDLDDALDLSRVAAFIWEEFDGARRVAEVVDAVVARFEVDRARAEVDALELVDALRARRAIVPGRR